MRIIVVKSAGVSTQKETVTSILSHYYVMLSICFTTNVVIGEHSHLNLLTTIGHDCRLGDYFTTAPAANISGNVITGKNVYIGANASVRQKVNMVGNTTIGMGAIVLNDIKDAGTYKGLIK